MKISYNWLTSILKTDKSPEEISALLTSCGLEVEGLEPFESIRGGLKGLVIGVVIEKEKHPDADRLSVTKVRVGDDASPLLQIVCGAPNVAAGQKVIVAPVDCEIFPISGEPFTIKKSKIRGQLSEGMICADDEVGLGNSDDGIRILPEDAPVGTLLSEYMNPDADVVLEIGLTPNRGDAASVLGVARDLRAMTGDQIVLPALGTLNGTNQHPISVQVLDSTACPRYSGVYIKGVSAVASPDWMQNRLKAIGIKPRNILVDSTNYVLHELGQPIHAFDADAIQGNIMVRTAEAGEKMTTLDQIERTFQGFELLICDEHKPLAIAGVFGGLHSGVNENTTCVFIESAYFDPASIRKTAKSQGLNTDASFRYERGTDPDITLFAMRRVAALILEYAGGSIEGGELDVYPVLIPPHTFAVQPDKIRQLAGADIPDETMLKILNGLDIEVEKQDLEWKVSVPARKHDVTRQVDIVEEILRIFGYDNVPFKKSLQISGLSGGESYKHLFRKKISGFLAAHGFNEIMSNSLTAESKLSEDNAPVRILNPLSGELGVMRNRMLSVALDSVAYNLHRKSTHVRFFEFGKIYSKTDSGFAEEDRLILLATGNKTESSWQAKPEKAGYFYIKALVEEILQKLGRKSALKDLEKWVEMGPVPAEFLKASDIKQEVWYADIAWGKILSFPVKMDFKTTAVRRFPEVNRDLSLVIKKSVNYADIETLARKSAGSKLIGMNLFDVYEGKPLEESQKSYAVSFTLYDDEKTLTEQEIDKIMNRLMSVFENELGAWIRK